MKSKTSSKVFRFIWITVICFFIAATTTYSTKVQAANTISAEGNVQVPNVEGSAANEGQSLLILIGIVILIVLIVIFAVVTSISGAAAAIVSEEE